MRRQICFLSTNHSILPTVVVFPLNIWMQSTCVCRVLPNWCWTPPSLKTGGLTKSATFSWAETFRHLSIQKTHDILHWLFALRTTNQSLNSKTTRYITKKNGHRIWVEIMQHPIAFTVLLEPCCHANIWYCLTFFQRIFPTRSVSWQTLMMIIDNII